MKKLIVALVLVAFATAPAFAGKTYTYAEGSSLGAVTFNHDAHKSQGCKTCHHAGMKSCKTCHDGAKAMSAKDAFHKNCKGCHKDKGQGPTGCKDCHKK